MGQPSATGPDIEASHRRSQLYGLDPARLALPYRPDAPPAAAALKTLSRPVLKQLLAQIADSAIGVVLADRSGHLTYRDAGDGVTLTAMDHHSIDVGFSLAESDAGTNGVGTSLETRRPAIVIGADHYVESLQAFTCANAPILHPITQRVEGTVGVVCPAENTNPLLLPTAMQLSAQIARLLLDRAAPEERFLLEQFLRHRRRAKHAIATMSETVLIATPSAQRLLAGVDQAELWAHVLAAVTGGTCSNTDFGPLGGPRLRLRCQPVFRGGDLDGAVVELFAGAVPSSRARRRRRRDSLGQLVGASGQWQAVVRDAQFAARSAEPTLIVGERGTGRFAIAEAIAGISASPHVGIFDSADVLLDGAQRWTSNFRETFTADSTIILRRIDQLPPNVAAAIATQVAASPSHARIIATSETTSSPSPGLAALLDQVGVLRIDVAPLRRRREDIAPIVQHLSARAGRRSVNADVMKVLHRQPWSGNVTEIRQVLRAAFARAGNGPLDIHHLPRHVRQSSGRRPLHGLRQREAEAIIEAVNAVDGNKSRAAQILGISRATLYRRLDAYGIDLDTLQA